MNVQFRLRPPCRSTSRAPSLVWRIRDVRNRGALRSGASQGFGATVWVGATVVPGSEDHHDDRERVAASCRYAVGGVLLLAACGDDSTTTSDTTTTTTARRTSRSSTPVTGATTGPT